MQEALEQARQQPAKSPVYWRNSFSNAEIRASSEPPLSLFFDRNELEVPRDSKELFVISREYCDVRARLSSEDSFDESLEHRDISEVIELVTPALHKYSHRG
jgi:hypothetical protein